MASGTGREDRYIPAEPFGIRSVQESGPYHLLGWSFGGIVAQEIAVQMQAAGEQVASLVLLDAYPAINGIQDREPHDLREQIRRQHGDLLGDISEEEFEIVARIFENNRMNAQAHVPGGFNGDLLIFTAVKGLVGTAPVARWEPYVSGRILEIPLPFGHGEMVQREALPKIWAGISEWLE